jgi:hypothetical protein
VSRPDRHQKHYRSAHKRLLQACVARFFAEHFPKLFGPVICERLAADVLALIERQLRPTAQLRPGQCLWNAVAIETRADSPRLKLVPVVLTLVDQQDIARREAGASIGEIKRHALARILEEAYQQGALLSMRDVGLLTWQHEEPFSAHRRAWEAQHQRLLPHPGTLQDMGSCLTHKRAIVVKVVYQHQDPRQVALQTKHSQHAVDHYLKDFHRVRTCYRQRPDLDFIHQVTGMSKHLIKQYIDLIETYESDPLTRNPA